MPREPIRRRRGNCRRVPWSCLLAFMLTAFYVRMEGWVEIMKLSIVHRDATIRPPSPERACDGTVSYVVSRTSPQSVLVTDQASLSRRTRNLTGQRRAGLLVDFFIQTYM